MGIIAMDHSVDPKKELLNNLGDLSAFEIFNNQVLVAVYIRPDKTKGGIYLTDKARDEDRYQGKVGLVIAMGPTAFVDDSQSWFKGVSIDLHDWVVFRPSDGWSLEFNGVLCRILDDTVIRGKIDRPDRVF